MYDKSKNLWGIDLGGTKIEGVILRSDQDIEVLAKHRVPTESSNGYEHVLNQIAKVIDELSNQAGYRPERVGICTPGSIDGRLGTIKNSNATALNGKPMQKDLASNLSMEVNMANDANCFALAESRLGSVKLQYPDANMVFGVILGTGIGGGLVINGKTLNGHHGIAGEWGHNGLEGYVGRPCFCKVKNCHESIFSGPSLEWYYEQKSGHKLGMKDIVTEARKGQDMNAVKTLNRLLEAFSAALSNVVNLLDPDVIVLGGGLSQIDELYQRCPELVAKYIFNHEFNTPIIKPILGDSAGVYGAAYL